jgi:hypothetical protein
MKLPFWEINLPFANLVSYTFMLRFSCIRIVEINTVWVDFIGSDP